MSQTDVIKEAYARARPDTVYETIELDHPSFAEPLRIITGWDEGMILPIGGGQFGTFQACQVGVTLPGVDKDGPTPAKITIDNVSDKIRPYLQDAILSSLPITLTYRAYASSDMTQPGDVIGDLELWDVDLTATSAEGTLKYKELELQAFPLATYDTTYYPALQDS